MIWLSSDRSWRHVKIHLKKITLLTYACRLINQVEYVECPHMMLKPKLVAKTNTNFDSKLSCSEETMVDLGEWKTSWDHTGVLNIRGMALAGLEWIQLMRCSYNLQIRLSTYMTRTIWGARYLWALMINRARHHGGKARQSSAKAPFLLAKIIRHNSNTIIP